jgi:colicin import membrane protein
MNHRSFFAVVALVGVFSTVNAQTTGDNFRVLDGSGHKESIGTNWNGHYYIIKLVNDKVTGLCIDNKTIADSNMSKYGSLVNRIVTQVRQDEAQGERDREQGARDREQAERDRDQAAKDQIQAGRDREQADRDRDQATRDREQSVRDREQADRDRAQAERDRQQAAEDRENLRKLTALLVDKKLIPDAASLKDLVLTEDELVINGKKASPEIHQEIKQQFSKWAHGGFSYGRNNCCTSIHIHTN